MILVILLLVWILVYSYLMTCCALPPPIDFESCVTAGNPVMGSYPRQCRDPMSGQTFTEVINQSTIYVYAPASIGNPHIAYLTVGPNDIDLIIYRDGEEADRLREAFDEIISEESLPLFGEVLEVIDGEEVLVMKSVQVSKEDPNYVWAISDSLTNYGFIGKVER